MQFKMNFYLEDYGQLKLSFSCSKFPSRKEFTKEFCDKVENKVKELQIEQIKEKYNRDELNDEIHAKITYYNTLLSVVENLDEWNILYEDGLLYWSTYSDIGAERVIVHFEVVRNFIDFS